MTSEELKSLSDKQLKERLHSLAGNVSYHNAAEGDCYRQEAGARAETKRKFSECSDECRGRGFEPCEILAGGNYLI